ncbi:hypothetical protein MO973_45370 [Paenibacillus sp. TRM 82003]|uniref:hypothetical protein n=1 Tax=Kineococcus sp. TRM81007 TaxID=2925831 RepID=UPI001F57BA14|nr:hypothetical protein [Kineococcus sp. TRM81007]MCI2240397.1 hypothetical protein [Kineococcus sp. TRM81007]MCI3927427.1 hypothetical protein [Paenibacillus sp. TRM 82003]
MPVQQPAQQPVQDPRASEATTVPHGDTARTAPPAFVAELSERVQQTRATIDSATAAGEEELAAAHLGELEGLVDLAAAHDVALPDTVAYLAAQQTEQHVELPAEPQPSVDLTLPAQRAAACPAT